MDLGRFLREPGPDPVLRLVVLDPVGALGPTLREALRPEAVVLPATPGEPLPPPSGTADGLPWALLAVADGSPEGATLPTAAARAVRAAGAPPARLLFSPGPTSGHGDAAAPSGDPLPCPVTLLLTGPDTAAVGAWQRLCPDGFTARLLGPEAWTPARGLPVTARLIKEELRVWPA
ncbi:hypothetical protein SCWH03_44760 [Streptomyces pacificus]|uniref:Uncharacterized protein n=2 Tax=Streptomyces pacificus TaxID=2705029 RepID=A0A6A0B1T0_9ACTN|nr:hypothetical protein SCWH03_44760 [Streptomyces pacificus]